MSDIASNFSSDPKIIEELEAMFKEKEIDGRVKHLEEQKGLEVQFQLDPAKMDVTASIKSKEGIEFKAMAHSKKMALSQCYTGFLVKVQKLGSGISA